MPVSLDKLGDIGRDPSAYVDDIADNGRNVSAVMKLLEDGFYAWDARPFRWYQLKTRCCGRVVSRAVEVEVRCGFIFRDTQG